MADLEDTGDHFEFNHNIQHLVGENTSQRKWKKSKAKLSIYYTVFIMYLILTEFSLNSLSLI